MITGNQIRLREVQGLGPSLAMASAILGLSHVATTVISLTTPVITTPEPLSPKPPKPNLGA